MFIFTIRHIAWFPWDSKRHMRHHCGTHRAWKSYSGLAIHMRYFIPLWLESHNWVIHLWEIFCISAIGKSYLSHPFIWDILYRYGWKIIHYIIPLWSENHTLVIHLHEKYCTFAVGKSSLKPGDATFFTLLYFFPLQLLNYPCCKDTWLYTLHHCDSFHSYLWLISFLIYDLSIIIRSDSYIHDSASRYINQ